MQIGSSLIIRWRVVFRMQISRQRRRRRKKFVQEFVWLCIQLWNHIGKIKNDKEIRRRRCGIAHSSAASRGLADFDSKKNFIIEVSKKICSVFSTQTAAASSISSPASLQKSFTKRIHSREGSLEEMICCRLVPELLPVWSSSSVPPELWRPPFLYYRRTQKDSLMLYSKTALQTSNLSNAQVSAVIVSSWAPALKEIRRVYYLFEIAHVKISKKKKRLFHSSLSGSSCCIIIPSISKPNILY